MITVWRGDRWISLCIYTVVYALLPLPVHFSLQVWSRHGHLLVWLCERDRCACRRWDYCAQYLCCLICMLWARVLTAHLHCLWSYCMFVVNQVVNLHGELLQCLMLNDIETMLSSCLSWGYAVLSDPLCPLYPTTRILKYSTCIICCSIPFSYMHICLLYLCNFNSYIYTNTIIVYIYIYICS